MFQSTELFSKMLKIFRTAMKSFKKQKIRVIMFFEKLL